MLHTKYQSSRPCGFIQEDFFSFSLYKPIYVKSVIPGGGHCWRQGHDLNKLGRVSTRWWHMLNIKALGFTVSDKKIFPCFFPYLSKCKICEHRGLRHFLPRGHNLNKLGPQGNATYQISRLFAVRFQTRKCFIVPPYISLCKTCDAWGRAIFGPRGIIWTNSTRWYYIPNIKALGLMVSDKKILPCFSLYKPMLNRWPWGGAIFGPKGII